MKTYSLGPTNEDDYLKEVEKFFIDANNPILWLVYWYKTDSYDGDGWSAMKLTDGSYRTVNLSHCSCYGAFDISEKSRHYYQSMTLNQVYKDLEDSYFGDDEGMELTRKTLVKMVQKDKRDKQ